MHGTFKESGLYGGRLYGGTLTTFIYNIPYRRARLAERARMQKYLAYNTYLRLYDGVFLKIQTLRRNLKKCGLYGGVLVKTHISSIYYMRPSYEELGKSGKK